MDTGRVTVNGIEFAYLEAGPQDGPLALCLHGFPDHAPTFESLLGDLAGAGFHAVAPWNRGYAPTALAPDGNYEPAALAADAVALADALGGDAPAVLVGHDWGALVTYAACAWRPQRFRRAVAMAVPPPPALASAFLMRPDQLKRSWYMFFFQMPIAEMAVSANDFAFIDMLWHDWSPGFEPPEPFMRALKDTLGSPGSLEAALGSYRATWNPPAEPDPSLADVRAAAGQPIAVPTLYLHGAADGCMAADLVDPEALGSHFPGGIDVEIVEGAGHFLHLERPDAVNRRVVTFLTS